MIEFQTLQPHMRVFALVGRFLFEWAYMEERLSRALSKALNLSALNGAIVSANVQLRNKIHILKVAVDLSPGIEKERKEHFRKVLTDIADYSYTRNMMAHDMFGEDESGDGVSFFVVKAKNKFDIPDATWSIEDFEAAYKRIDGFARELVKLEKELDQSALFDAFQRMATGEDTEMPTSKLPGPGLLGLLSLLPPDALGSGQANTTDQTDGKTPPSSQE